MPTLGEIGTAVGIAGDVAGLMGGGGSPPDLTNEVFRQSQKQWRVNRKDSKRLIRDRVADAKKAGIHPLYALGAASNSNSPTMTMSGQSNTGSHMDQRPEYVKSIGRSISSLDSAQSRALNASAMRDEAEAALTLSRMKREEAAGNVSQDGIAFTSQGGPAGMVNTVPSEVVSASKKDQSKTAGEKPAFQTIVVGTNADGSKRTAEIPWSDEGPFDEFGPAKAVMTLLKALGVLDANKPKYINRKTQRDWEESYRREAKKRRY